MIELDKDNIEFYTALQLINDTSQSVFLTGKAGTGKTTFLHYLLSKTKKKAVVIAPTGVAAVNAGGQTIHSLFKIEPSVYLPTDKRLRKNIPSDDPEKISIYSHFRYTEDQKKVVKEIELLVIDEVSMVRCDLLDVIDRLLRVFGRNKSLPFGGVQLLLIGDPFQLSPIAKKDVKVILAPFYESEFFFDAKSYASLNPVFIELKKVYRQTDQRFINLLNRIRENKISEKVMLSLNNRYIKDYDFYDDLSNGKIYLGTHNDDVNFVNNKKLGQLEGQEYTFRANISGKFKSSDSPANEVLKLKVESQVMILKNDIENDIFNGKICTLSGVDVENETLILRDKMGKKHQIEKFKWIKYRYFVNKDGNIDKEEIGSMEQYPVKLAWAISVHKSQGLTFHNVIANLKSAFTDGQVYVGLSRCTSYEGLVLTERIPNRAIKTSPKVSEFYKLSSSQEELIELLNINKASQLYDEGRELLKYGQFDEAIKIFHDANKTVDLIFSEKGIRWMKYYLYKNQMKIDYHQNRHEQYKMKTIETKNHLDLERSKFNIQNKQNEIRLNSLQDENNQLRKEIDLLKKRKWYQMIFRK